MTERTPLFLTTAIPYVNGPPHVGFALELMYTDAYARFQRLQGKEVRFVTGTDEHGLKIARKASERGQTPQAFTDELSDLYRALGRALHVSTDDFIRTTEERHRRAVRLFCERVRERGNTDKERGPYLYQKTYAGWYCVGCEAFKTEKELVNGLCPDHQRKPEYLEEQNYFFRLSAFEEALKTLYAERSDFVIPETRFNEAKQFVEQGLEDMSITRSTTQLTWGIPFPGDETQVIYVWFDALVNYISACGFGSDEERFQKFWPTAVHVIGKEINRFHAILWTAMCMAAGIPPPRQIAIHGWIHVDGQKMSKSLGNVIDPKDLIGEYGAEALRYLFLRYIPFQGDGDYSNERYRGWYHSDLANNFGNLVHRVTNMTQKYVNGRVPDRSAPLMDLAPIWERYTRAMEQFAFPEALELVWRSVIDYANRVIDERKPWVLAKEGRTEELHALLYGLLELLRHTAWMIRPVMPETSDVLLNQLGQTESRQERTIQEISPWGGMEPGTKIEVREPLFPRLAEH